MSDAFLTPAPGAKAAKVCGILAIVFALTCVGFPIAIILGIVALVQQGKAKRLAKAQPEVYEAVPATGLVTGIIGLVLPVLVLPVVGIASAIAIPAFLGQRERAREMAVQANLNVVKAQTEAALLDIQARLPGQAPSQDAILLVLSGDPVLRALRNPITPALPAFKLGHSGPLGTVMAYATHEEHGGVTTWALQFRAVLKKGGEEKVLQEEVITHTQEKVQGPTEDGGEIPQPPAEPPAPVPTPAN